MGWHYGANTAIRHLLFIIVINGGKKMKGNKKSYLTEFRLWIEKSKDKHAERLVKKLKASPIGYPLYTFLFSIGFILVFGFTLLFIYSVIKPVPFEVEGNCNTGFIGIDFQSDILNEPYKQKLALSTTYFPNGSIEGKDIRFVTHFDRELLPKKLNLKNIDGLNCNFKVKGAIPLSLLLGDW